MVRGVTSPLPPQLPLSLPTIGKLRAVIGSVIVTRVDASIASPTVGDLVYRGDLIETGLDGLVDIEFAGEGYVFTKTHR